MPRQFWILLLLFAGMAGLALADERSDETELVRARFEKLKADPVAYARLQRNLSDFLALTSEKQAQLRKLDSDLQEEDSTTQARLQRVLERYSLWLKTLPESDRQLLDSTKDGKAKIQRIRDLLDREWSKKLPRAIQEQLATLPPGIQAARIAEYRKEDRKRREQWTLAMRHWDALTDRQQHIKQMVALEPEIAFYIRESLAPMLGPVEKNRLRSSKGQWPQFPETLVELADKHPVFIPGKIGPRRFEELPPAVQEKLPMLKAVAPKALPPLIRKTEGKWPQYAEAVTQFALNQPKPISIPPLGETRPDQFTPEIKEFIQNRLYPILARPEIDRLQKTAGTWPAYPRLLQTLARKYGMNVPGTALPGPADLWEPYRTRTTPTAGLPDLPDGVLLEFAKNELSQEEKSRLPSLSVADPAVRGQLLKAYFDRHPAERKRLQRTDENKGKRKQ